MGAQFQAVIETARASPEIKLALQDYEAFRVKRDAASADFCLYCRGMLSARDRLAALGVILPEAE